MTFREAEIYAELVEVEGMKAENQVRDYRGESPAYNEQAFRERAETIRNLARDL